MPDFLPLPIYAPDASLVNMEALKRAKQALGVDFLVKPVRAVPGGSDRVLSIGTQHAPWAVDSIGVRTCDSPGLVDAMQYVLCGTEDKRARTILAWLRGIFGPGVNEILPEAEPDWGTRGEEDPNATDEWPDVRSWYDRVGRTWARNLATGNGRANLEPVQSGQPA